MQMNRAKQSVKRLPAQQGATINLVTSDREAGEILTSSKTHMGYNKHRKINGNIKKDNQHGQIKHIKQNKSKIT